ncbi:MAG: hypothetical protein J5851_01255 [Oscillospiraceae bacterium]|nr:hypothetical protein [Oscillospiraceae bacterium]
MKLHTWIKRTIAAAAACAMLAPACALLPADAAEVPDFSGLGAVGCLTEAQTCAAAESIYKALESHADVANLSTSTDAYVKAGTEQMDSLMNVFATVVGGYDAGVLTNKNSISLKMAYSPRRGNYISGIVIYYLVDDAVYSKTYNNMIDRLDAISAQVDPAWSDVEKALFLHEYIAVHYDYDTGYADYPTEDEEYLCHTVYGMFTRGKAVCEAYAWLYDLLLRREGIDSFMVCSTELGHAWNLVELDGEWAHVDITWDDCYQEHCGVVLHDSFLKSSDAMRETKHSGDDWVISTGTPVSEMNVTDRYNSGFWNGSRAAICRYQNQWLAIKPDSKAPAVGWFYLYDYDPATLTADCTEMLSLTLYWDVIGAPTYYTGTFISADAYGDVLYYSTPDSLMAYYDGEVYWQLDLTDEQLAGNRIYGMYIDGDTLYYALSASPSGAVTRCSVKLSDLPGITAPATEEPTEPEPATEPTEAPTEPETEPATEPTEPETEPTEAVTEPPTEPVTEPATEPETEPTEAPTEPETEPTEPPTEAPTEPEQGDLDGDGEITVTDVIFLQQYLLCLTPLTPEEAACADLMPDGTVDVFDLGLLKRMLLEKTS